MAAFLIMFLLAQSLGKSMQLHIQTIRQKHLSIFHLHFALVHSAGYLRNKGTPQRGATQTQSIKSRNTIKQNTTENNKANEQTYVSAFALACLLTARRVTASHRKLRDKFERKRKTVSSGAMFPAFVGSVARLH